jgi:sarcosine oxidase subunit gamma
MRESILRESPLVRLNRASSGANSAAGAGLIVREKAFLGHLNLRGKAEDPHFAGAVGVVMGDELPIVANTLTELNGVTMYWLGPDEWLIVTPDESRNRIEHDLRRALASQHFALTDVSGGQTALHLHGSRVRDVLAKGCPIDFHPRVFGIGQCAQSHLGKATVLIGQIEGSHISSSSSAAASRSTCGRGSRRPRRNTEWRWAHEHAGRGESARHRALRSRLHAARRRRYV